jgi:hypothetical protein
VAAFGISDPLFHASSFGKLPVLFLRSSIEYFSKQEQQRVNSLTIGTAKLACLVYGALGGKNKTVGIEEFLPYELIKTEKQIKDSTIAAIKWALKHERMPPAVIGMIGAELG